MPTCSFISDSVIKDCPLRERRVDGMKTLREQHIEIIRKWQAGEKSSELVKNFEEISAILADSPACTVDDDIYEAVHDINNFLQTEMLLRYVAKL